MCRKRYMYGCAILCFGLGIMIGHWVNSWFLCSAGGIALVILGVITMRR